MKPFSIVYIDFHSAPPAHAHSDPSLAFCPHYSAQARCTYLIAYCSIVLLADTRLPSKNTEGSFLLGKAISCSQHLTFPPEL